MPFALLRLADCYQINSPTHWPAIKTGSLDPVQCGPTRAYRYSTYLLEYWSILRLFAGFFPFEPSNPQTTTHPSGRQANYRVPKLPLLPTTVLPPDRIRCSSIVDTSGGCLSLLSDWPSPQSCLLGFSLLQTYHCSTRGRL